jgi:type I restriction enzyme S subunit
MQKYPAYKASGAEWLGEIPSHWEIIRLKNIIRAKITDGPHVTPEFIDEGIPFLSVDGIQNGELVFENSRLISLNDHIKYQKKCRIEKFDILMGKAASIGKIAQSKVDFEYSIWSPLALIKPNLEKFNATFMEYYLKSTLSQYQIEILCTSNTQKNISMDDIPKIILTFPPLPEQTAIAAFLDRKTALIDQAIDINQKQIELLKERRQILIHNAVTRGLNPNVKMKDSGVEWIGEIPEGWEVKKIKHISSKIGSGVTPSGGGTTYLESGIPLLRSQNVLFGKIELEGVAFISDKIHESMSNSQVKKGDVLLNITGGSIGRCHYVDFDSELNVNQHVCIIRPTKGITSLFLNSILSSEVGQGQIWFNQQGGGREGLNFQSIKNFFLPLPSIMEQKLICDFIEQTTTKIATAISLKEQEIERLKEYKATLINSAVTGKIKVC